MPSLFGWLGRLFPIWTELTDEGVYLSALVSMAEMALTGCTTTTDQLYLYPNDCTLDAEIRAATDLGMRFQPARGMSSFGRSQGGFVPDALVQPEDVSLADCQRLIERYHDPSPRAMLRMVVAPGSPWSVTTDLMRESAALARAYPGVRLHTHVAETLSQEEMCLGRFGVRPAEYMRQLGWVGPDVWWAHGIWLDAGEIALLRETGTGVAHCPSSNMRTGAGICKVRELLDAGVNVGLALDGAAAQDTCNMIAEVRMALLLQRVAKGPTALTVMEALQLATVGSAAVLGRDDIGQLAPGNAADFIGVRLDRIELAGAAVHDPVAAIVLSPPRTVDLSVINGRIVVENGQLVGLDVAAAVARLNRLAARMAGRHPLEPM